MLAITEYLGVSGSLECTIEVLDDYMDIESLDDYMDLAQGRQMSGPRV